jgi:hypothetical protein
MEEGRERESRVSQDLDLYRGKKNMWYSIRPGFFSKKKKDTSVGSKKYSAH